MSNTFGKIFRITSFGESHGHGVGGVIDGCPAAIAIDEQKIAKEMTRRRPGQSDITTARSETDRVIILSGVYNGRTTGAPIGFIIENKGQRSEDYDNISEAFRPGHADYTYYIKYGGFNDPRGGGRSSARETAVRVAAGAIARQVLEQICPNIIIQAYTQSIGEVSVRRNYYDMDLSLAESNTVRCPDMQTAGQMEALIKQVKAEGDTVGGTVRCIVRFCPAGIGDPVYGKLSARLADAMMSINAAKGFEIGDGFEMAAKRGSDVQDNWIEDNTDPRGIRTIANHSGGIQGGISNGENIDFTVAFKPVATLMRDVRTVDKEGKPVVIQAKGRHDACVVPRAVPVVEAMTALVLVDSILIARATKL